MELEKQQVNRIVEQDRGQEVYRYRHQDVGKLRASPDPLYPKETFEERFVGTPSVHASPRIFDTHNCFCSPARRKREDGGAGDERMARKERDRGGDQDSVWADIEHRQEEQPAPVPAAHWPGLVEVEVQVVMRSDKWGKYATADERRVSVAVRPNVQGLVVCRMTVEVLGGENAKGLSWIRRGAGGMIASPV